MSAKKTVKLKSIISYLFLFEEPTLSVTFIDGVIFNLANVVTSPPKENFTTVDETPLTPPISAFLSDTGLCTVGLGVDCCRVICTCTGDDGRLRLLKRFTSNADKLLCRHIFNKDGGSKAASGKIIIYCIQVQ